MKVTILIETSPDFFRSWLEDFTLGVHSHPFPTEKGHVSLQRARPSRRPGCLSMEGIYCSSGDGNSQKAFPLSDVIHFKMIPLSASRTEIVAQCNQPVVEEYFLHLLDAIDRRWPQPPNLDQRLVAIEHDLDAGFAEVKRGQAVLYERLDQTTRESLKQIQASIILGRVEQREMADALAAIRRVLRLMQVADTHVQRDLREFLETAQTTVDSERRLQHKLAFTLPILPLFLNYSLELTAASSLDMKPVVSEVKTRWCSLVARARDPGEGSAAD